MSVSDDGVPLFANPAGLAPEDRTPPPEQTGWEELGLYRYWATGAVADYDRDGRVDAFLVEWFPELPARLFRKETPQAGHWLEVDIAPQRLAVGAHVLVYRNGALGDPNALIVARDVAASTGFAAGVPTSLHLGLGDQPVVDVRIVLPHGAGVLDFPDVAAGGVLEVDAPTALDAPRG